MPTLTIDHLNKSFGETQALRDMTFSVGEGEIFGFVGSNGAGKSTTMRIALGVLAKDSGEVYFDDAPINDDNRRRIGYMPEERGLYGKEPLLSQLVFLGTLHGMDKSAAKRAGAELLEQLGLGERMDDKLDDLSLGNQQRVQLAASLIHDPDMLRERANRGVPVIFSSHQLDLVQRLCDRVGIVTKGHMVAEGGVDKLRSQGPPRFEVATPARGWYPEGTELVAETADAVVLEADETIDDQAILQAALAAGPVHSFGRKIPDLTELFQDVVTSNQNEEA